MSRFWGKFKFFIFFYLSGIIIHTGLVSFASFFNFIFLRKFYSIQLWLQENRWNTLCLAKILSLFLTLTIINVIRGEAREVRSYILNYNFKKKHFYVISFSLILSVVFFSICLLDSSSFTFLKVSKISDFIGPLIFYFTDGLLFLYLFFLKNSEKEMAKGRRAIDFLIPVFFLSVIVYFCNLVTYSISLSFSVWQILSFFYIFILIGMAYFDKIELFSFLFFHFIPVGHFIIIPSLQNNVIFNLYYILKVTLVVFLYFIFFYIIKKRNWGGLGGKSVSVIVN